MPRRGTLSDRLKRLDLGRRNLEFSLDSFAHTGDKAALLRLATELRAQVYTHGQTPLLLQLTRELGVPLKIYGQKLGFLDHLCPPGSMITVIKDIADIMQESDHIHHLTGVTPV